MHTSPGVTRQSVALTGRLIVAVGVVLSSLASGVASAAPPRSAIDLPRGLYCSCPPTTAQGSRSVMPAVARLPYVDGILVRVSWADLAPALGAYRWELLDRELAQAQDYGKKVALAVVNGPGAPAWLSAQGAQRFTYRFRDGAAAMPVPWDRVYLAAWSDFIKRLGERYRDRKEIAVVHITHASFNGFEMQLPSSPADRVAWQAAGYSEQRLLASWKSVIDAFAQAFPRTALDVDVHPVLGADAVAQAVAEYGRQRLDARFGLFAGWWSERNTRVYAGMYALIKRSAATRFATAQLAQSYTRTPASFGTGGLAATIDLALAGGVRYLEVWNDDLLNPALGALLHDTSTRLHR